MVCLRSLLRALLCALVSELYAGLKTTASHGFWYFIKHLICTLYLTYKTKGSDPRFPEHDITFKKKTGESIGVIYPEKEWVQERPKSKEHLKAKYEDIHIFQGSHIETGSTLVLRLSRLQEGLCQAWIVLQVGSGEVLTVQNEVKLDMSDEYSYYGCGVKLECLAPMRKWRIAFNGLMKNARDDDIHVKFGAIWVAGSHIFEYPHQVSVKSMADSLSNLNLFTMVAQVESIYNDEFAYSQAGNLSLQVTLEDEEAKDIYLWGNRMHFSGRLEPRCEVHKFAHIRDGHRLHLISRPIENQMVIMGTVYDPSSKTLGVQAEEVSGRQLIASSDYKKYTVRISKTMIDPITISSSHPSLNDKFIVAKENAIMDGEAGTVLTMKVKRYNRPLLAVPEEYLHQKVNTSRHVTSLVLATTEEDCKRSNYTGGKGSSLAVLNSISNQFSNFTVPRAVVLTTNAYDLFSEQPSVKVAVLKLVSINKMGGDSEALKKACDECVQNVEKADIPAKVVHELSRMMAGFGSPEKIKFAVRSSAVGEDSEEMSAAGQMTTFLGVPGYDIKLLSRNVAKCWASQFSFTAVNYKRQYGQPVAAKMAVVVQEMVSAQAAGVMFTCDPVTSNPQTIAITANYGLGESVVSASAEPDTFIVKRLKNGTMKIVDVQVGKKLSAVVEDENGGTIEKEINNDDASKECISAEIVEKLAVVGHQVESCFTTARDIEWAVKDDKLYLLQCRPVTSITKETDFEIINDCNSGEKSEGEIYSKATIAEILPGTVSPLGISVMNTIFDTLCRDMIANWRPGFDFERSLYVNSMLPVFRKHYFSIMSDRDPGSSFEKSMMYAAYGRDISEDEPMRMGVVRKPLPAGVTKIFGLIKLLSALNEKVNESSEFSKSFKIYTNENISAGQQLHYICNAFATCKAAGLGLFYGFLSTAMYDLVVMQTLAKSNKGEITPALLTEVAGLLQAGEIESVDVPLSLQRLGAGLSRSPYREQFINMNPEEAYEWLYNVDSEDGKRFREFLSKHGHRCVKEFDVYIKPWAMNPANLVKTLQAAARTPHDPKAPGSINFDLDKLCVKLNFLQKQILKFFIPKARNAVAMRELAKSATIRVVHRIREALHVLARLLVQEGRLPDAELTFFLQFDEIKQLIETRNPTLVAKAIRRRRLHPGLDNERYPVLQWGIPKQVERLTFANTLMELKGTPVCQGLIEGSARVVTHFDDEAHLIQKGEILVTTATDTGWTPYFPLLGGVVTEVGGLVSHGAVVAREYGLPCVVGIENATQIFKSGDLLRLDGGKGTIQKIEKN